MAAGLCAATVVVCFVFMAQGLAAGDGLVAPLAAACVAALVGGYLWNRAKDEESQH